MYLFKVASAQKAKSDYEYSVAYEPRGLHYIKTNQYFPKFSSMDQSTLRFNFRDRFYDFDKQERTVNSRRVLKPIESKLLNSEQVRKSLIHL
jgi:hypothetical protein